MNDAKNHEQVTIHIDKKMHKSPEQTTGAALYILGGIQSGYILFKEVHGQGDDVLVKNDITGILLANGDHFYSAKEELNPGQ